MLEIARTFWLLLLAHAVSDYALQSRFMSEYKSPGAPRLAGEVVWPWILSAHALVNAGGVLLITGSMALSLAEATLHWLIDYGKGRHAYGFRADQALHVSSKILLAVIAVRL